MGIVPQLSPPLSDVCKLLSRFDSRRATAASQALTRRFPQIELSIVVTALGEDIRLKEYVFWLFNRAGLSSAVERGGKNRHILLLINVQNRKAVAMIGYGLEPFVAERHLQSCLVAADAALKRGEFGRCCEAFAEELTRQLSEVQKEIDRAFGLSDDDDWEDASAGHAIQVLVPAMS
jgi:uncharacterized membrane protein YgcG